jgi:hypothetical protein
VITGGRLSGDESIDAVWTDGGVRFLHAPRSETQNVRGGGSTFSAAIAARLALGLDVHDAVTTAKEYATKAIAGSKNWQIGRHTSPVDNLGFTTRQEMTVRSSAFEAAVTTSGSTLGPQKPASGKPPAEGKRAPAQRTGRARPAPPPAPKDEQVSDDPSVIPVSVPDVPNQT